MASAARTSEQRGASRCQPPLAAHREVVARHRREARLDARLGERGEQRLDRRLRGGIERQLERFADQRDPIRGPPIPRPRAPPGRQRPLLSRRRPRPPGAIPPARRAPGAGRTLPSASAAPAAVVTPCRAGARRSAGRRDPRRPAMPCGFPRATTRPCSRFQRCTSSTGPPPKTPRAMGSFQRPLATSKQVQVDRIRRPARQRTMPLTLPRGPGTTDTASPEARSSRSSAGSSLPPSRSARVPPSQCAARAAPPTATTNRVRGFPDRTPESRSAVYARAAVPAEHPTSRASLRTPGSGSPSDQRPSAISCAKCAASEAEPICTGTARYRFQLSESVCPSPRCRSRRAPRRRSGTRAPRAAPTAAPSQDPRASRSASTRS